MRRTLSLKNLFKTGQRYGRGRGWKHHPNLIFTHCFFYSELQHKNKQTKKLLKNPQDKDCFSCSSRCSFAIPKVQNRGEFPLTPGLDETLSPANTPDPSFHSRETQAVGNPDTPQPALPMWETGGPELQGMLRNTSALQPPCDGSEYTKNILCGTSCFTPRLFLQDILQENQLPWVTSAVFGYHPLAKAGLSLKSVSISVRGSFSWIKKPEFEGILMGKQSLERTPATMQQMLLFSTRPRVASSAGSS